jgi:hypothetical protein
MAGSSDIDTAARAILRDGKIVEAEPIAVASAGLDAGDASALVTGDLEPRSRITGERAALIQGATNGVEKGICRIDVAGDVVIEGCAEFTQVSARHIWVGGPVVNCQLVAQGEIVLKDDAVDSVLVTGELADRKRQLQRLKEAVRLAKDRAATLERQLSVSQKRLGSAIARSSFTFEFSAGQICRRTRDRLVIDLAPLYKMLEDKSDAEVDLALLEFFTRGVVGYLARVNRQQILDNPSRQKVFVALTRALHEVFVQTRDRDHLLLAAQASRGELQALTLSLKDHGGAVHIGGELLPGSELRFTKAIGERDGEIESVSAGMKVGAGLDDDHREVIHTNPEGEESKQIVDAETLLGASLELRDGRVVWGPRASADG